jgi:hypothetical protein
MMKPCCLAALLALAAPGAALANSPGCGENAFSYAEVVEAKPAARKTGPLVSVPDSLCADLVEDRPRQINSLNLTIGDPGRTPTSLMQALRPDGSAQPNLRSRHP